MSVLEIIALAVGAWFAISALIAALAGRVLHRRGRDYPPV